MNKIIKLNLGSSKVKLDGFLNVDINKDSNPDIVWDLNKLPYPFENESIDEIEMNCVIEHLDIHLIDFLKEAKRILKHKGKLHLRTDNFFYYRSRITHLFANWNDNEMYHPFHSWILDYNYVVKLCKHLGFSVIDRKIQAQLPYMNFLEKYYPNMFARYVDIILWNHSKR